VLSTAGAVVSGVASDADGQPVNGVRVVLIPEGEKRKYARLYRDASSDQSGGFVFRDVAPGEYKVFCWERIENGEWQDPDVLRPFEDKGVRVTAKESGSATVEVRVIPGGGAAPQQ